MKQAVADAIKAGFTHVNTAGGWVPLRDWDTARDDLTFDASQKAIVGAWEKPDAVIRLYLKDQGLDPDQYRSRDAFPLGTHALEARTRELENNGATRSDAQGVAEIDQCPVCGGCFNNPEHWKLNSLCIIPAQEEIRRCLNPASAQE